MDCNSSQTKYVISLDAIDLNYIPTVNRYKGNEVTQIWTKRNLNVRNNEYFEFEIKENDIELIDGDCANPQYTYITCHICNLDVPKPFLKEHFNSKKHKTFKKIIDISLERLKRINEQDVFEDSKIWGSVYFCTSCVAVVEFDEKILHEKSLAHKNALMVEKFLNDFLDLYEDKKENTNDLKSSKSIMCNECDNNNSNIQSNNKVSLNIDKVPIANKENKNKADEKIQIKDSGSSDDKAVKIESTTNEITTVPKVHDSKRNLAAYVDFLINTTNLKEIKVLQNNNLEIDIKSGAKVIIIEHNFNSIIKLTKNMFQCISCLEVFPKNHKWDHLYKDKHVQFVTIAFNNENCIRKVDHMRSHCALCNTEILNIVVDEHIRGRDHKLRLDEALQVNTGAVAAESQDNHVETASTSKHNCEDIEKNNTITLKEAESHHKFHNSDKVLTNLIQELKILELYRTFDLSDNVNNDYMCKVCKCFISNNYIKVTEHISSAYHIENYTKLLSLNNITQCTEDSFHCAACNTTVSKKLTLLHIADKLHLHNLSYAVEPDKQNATPKLSITHTKMETKIPVEPDTVLLKIDGSQIKDNSFYCAICSSSVPNHNFNIYTHLATASHINSATKLSSGVFGLHYHMDLTQFPNITCVVCDVKLTLHEKNINTHVNGNPHKQNYKLKLEDNKIEKNGNNYLCTICSISISPTNELIHCLTRKHIQKLNQISGTLETSTPDISTTKTSTPKTSTPKTSTPKTSTPETCTPDTDTPESGLSITDMQAEVEDKTYLLKDYGHPKQLFCLACNTNIPNTFYNISTHLKGSKHLQLYKSTLDSNYIVNSCGDFKCELCNMFIVTGKEFVHINTKNHEGNIKNAMKYKCAICQVILTKNDDNIRVHNNGEQHKNMVELAALNNIRVDEDKCFCGTCDKYIDNESIGSHLNSSLHVMHSFSNGN